jgi:single-strand DNA-binding protein
MATLNDCTFIGRLGKEPELQVIADGTPFTRFSIAIDQAKNQDPMWLNIVCWKDLAERMEQMLYKGALVFVQGRLQIRHYEDKNHVTRQAVDIIATNVQLLDKKKQGSTASDGSDLPDLPQ